MSDRLAVDIFNFLVTLNHTSWEGTATELEKAFHSEHKPKRPEDLAKAVLAITRRTTWLRFEKLRRVDNKRPFRLTLTLENAGSAGSAGHGDELPPDPPSDERATAQPSRPLRDERDLNGESHEPNQAETPHRDPTAWKETF